MMNGAGWAMGAGGWLWMILGLVVVVAIVWLAVSATTVRRGSATDDAAQILKARVARGEINEAEYQQARRLLGMSHPLPVTRERD